MGDSARAGKAASYAVDNVIYEWQLLAGIAFSTINAVIEGQADGIEIFSLMMVAMLFKGPFQAIVAANSTFTKLETERNKGKMIFVKATYVGMQCLLLTLGVWKIGQMGLLPTTQSDWVAFEDQRMCLEKAYFAT